MSKWLKFLTILSILALVMAACTPPAPAGNDNADENDNADATEDPTEVATEDPTEAAGDDGGSGDGEPVTIRWFVGLGTGGNPEQIAAQEEVVADFNESHD